ncbi:PREDICTED: uncharacterized protein LOC105316423 [Amphimedon queenslandica]|uniref:pyridoxal 5'-phosphate synthase n=1 Tax=Amphimedon queenslandica TaxID=400682 RepID=A0A1X7VP40_AMPQE|nr:PREDICTED: uncharacterized protein LOC105316423 [Amphimedon queenslandica]|eukprot:XP_011409592.1 PREDICTED: uncharacterized protein LOC105316423 [Amphimedon queenslandica]
MEELTESQLVVPYDPLFQVNKWIEQENEGSTAPVPPVIMCLSTVSSDCTPSSRYVDYGGIEDGGFPFYTDSTSRKVKELTSNPKVSVVIFLAKFSHQIRIEGIAKELGKERAQKYFDSLDRKRQITLLLGQQDKPIASKEELVERRKKIAMEYSDPSVPVPLPENWMAYTVIPHSIELFQGSEDWLADRLVFKKEGNKWNLQRLMP